MNDQRPAEVEDDGELVNLNDPRWVPSVDDKAAADDAITAARQDSSSQLRQWSPKMDETVSAADTVVQERRWADEGIPATDRPPYPSRLSATAPVPQAIVSARREACTHCGGTGFMPGVSDYLRQSIQLVGDQGDELVRTFYGVLFRGAPELVKLFPGNPTEGQLGTDHRGVRQRELLLNALVALSDLYDPDDPERMERLDTALASFGRKHAAFARPDGTIKGATLEEYAAVKNALFAVLVQATGKAWRPEFTEAWNQAYDYAAGVMIAEQYRSGFAAPRFARA